MVRSEKMHITRYFNWPLLAAVVSLTIYGAIVVRSATSGMTAGDAMIQRHLVGVLLGLVFLVVAMRFDYRSLHGWLGPLMLFNLLLIISPRIPGIGAEAGGATAWLQVAGFRLFQPSEPAKLVTIVIMAIVIGRYAGVIDKSKDMVKVFAFLLVPLAAIMLQPDLGTGLVFVAITLGMLMVGGLKPRLFLVIALVGIVAVAGVLQAGLLQEYQKNRLLVFVNPELDPRGAGYNLAQSKIAVGSGGIAGNGLGTGTQGNLNFLPERHTDFIFAVLGEELGFIGAIGLLLLYLMLLLTALNIASQSRDLFGTLIAAGIVSMWTFQILQNIGMSIGLMPITGLPLPFMSFGSSFMIVNFAAVGMLLSIWSRRYGA
ncbi:MAG: rod shape-determining protein RodA [Actinobacteria bacterium]|nr:rod shape-determining protein RodA [Actinomycetota bacterium]MCL5888281.1 rod shape-determining protein RodA [Actinomycetota bacterium]